MIITQTFNSHMYVPLWSFSHTSAHMWMLGVKQRHSSRDTGYLDLLWVPKNRASHLAMLSLHWMVFLGLLPEIEVNRGGVLSSPYNHLQSLCDIFQHTANGGDS